ncbi:tetratricopeptide repeat protein [Glaciimonas sp. GS1]|uniref:Tetratricopeptide repeat protein n=2 Tax=Glaciimonas soli TaxID=2590999 RepID=A0A843YS84_9BURK|nr:tetratricopeptide repeat protein [Glaciimonas soli]
MLTAGVSFAQTNNDSKNAKPPVKESTQDAATAPKTDDAKDDANDSAGAPTSGKIAHEHLPSASLSPRILAGILNAEIAFQRGNWQAGYVTLLSLAQQTRDPRLARRAAEMALTAKHPTEALTAIRLWRELAPDSEEAAQYYLGFVMLSNHLEEAQPLLAQRLKNSPPKDRGVLMLQIQRLLTRSEDKAGAFKLLENLVAPYADMAEAHVALAQAAFANNDSARANQEAARALQLNPESELAILTSAQVSPDKQAAEKTIADFLAQHPKSHEIRIAYARTLIEQKQYEKARAQFDILYKDNKEDATTLLALGLLNAQIGDTKAAEQFLSDYVDELAAHPDPRRDNSQALMILAKLAMDRKDNASALIWLSRVGPGDAYLDAQLKRAELTARGGDVDGARTILSEIETSKESDEILVAQVEAQILQDAHRYMDAFNVLETALKAHPENIDLLYDYALIADKLNNTSVMETALRKVMKLSPDSAQAYNALGYSFAVRNTRLPEALTLVKKASALSPKDPFIMDSLGWVEFRMGNLVDAESHLQMAYSTLPDPEIGIHLGEVLWAQGKKDAAQKVWREVRSKDPKSTTLNETLKRLQVVL